MTMDMETALLTRDKAQRLVQKHLTNVKQKLDSLKTVL